MKKKKVNLSLRKITVASLNDDLKKAIKGGEGVGSGRADCIGGATNKSKDNNGLFCISEIPDDGGACLAQF